MTGKWEKLREWADAHIDPRCRDNPTAVWHRTIEPFTLLDEMDRLEREEAAGDSGLGDLIHTLRLVADDHEKEASYGGAGREWQERACSAVRRALERIVDGMSATPPVPIPSAEACWDGKWKDDSDNDELDPGEGEPFCYWWEDLRRREVRELVQNVYERGYARGKKDYLRSLRGGGSMPCPCIVCLCGSTRFYTEFRQANYERTMAGEIVLSVGFFMHSGDPCTPEQKEAADELHLRKIDLCDYVYVLNVNGYIGSSTRKEIEYAEKIGRPVEYLEPLHGAEEGKG